MNNLISKPRSFVWVKIYTTHEERRFVSQMLKADTLRSIPSIKAFTMRDDVVDVFADDEANLYDLQFLLMDGFEQPTDFRSELLGDIQ